MTGELRARDIKLHHVGELQFAAIVKIGSGVFEIPQSGRFELGDRCGQTLIDRAILVYRADDGREIGLWIGNIGIDIHVPEPQVGKLRAACNRRMAEILGGVRMIWRNGHVLIEILISQGERRDCESRERASPIGRVVLLLRDARVVKTEVGEIGRGMARYAVSGVLGTVGWSRRSAEEDFQTSQFRGTEGEGLGVILEAAVGPVNECGI